MGLGSGHTKGEALVIGGTTLAGCCFSAGHDARHAHRTKTAVAKVAIFPLDIVNFSFISA